VPDKATEKAMEQAHASTREPCELSATEAGRLMAEGQLSSEELVRSCLGRIDRLEPTIGAWVSLDRELLLAQAHAADERRRSGQATELPLNGIPIGIKDVFDTADLPTENGTPAHQGRRPPDDAAAVRLLRQSGALIAGKTVTAELAVYFPGKTVNPYDPQRTPGGSSSGSAAAVACSMVPIALGTQTNGSVIRPASYCGVVGFKPTYGSIPRAGVLRQSPRLDQIGVFSRTVADSTLAVSILQGDRTPQGDMLPWPKIDPERLQREPKQQPRLAMVRTPAWSSAEPQTRRALLRFVAELGCEVQEITLPAVADLAVACHRTIMLSEMAHHYRPLVQEYRHHLSPKLLAMIEDGATIGKDQYIDALGLAEEITGAIDAALDPCTGTLTPATPAVAPEGLESTGSPIFSTLWSLCGVPAISLPLLTGENRLPLGLQIVAARGRDQALVQTAHWLEQNTPHR
jgi:Asp-tRNA(Asn)/Glu-tRNA(Gln) amidotransferase A subunit family amidase